jgi:uncharacterized membrane protein YfcA
MYWGFSFAILIGISLGLLGGGGSILTVPIFVYVMGWEPKVAIAASLAVVGLTSLVGVLPHHRQGNLNFRVAVIFGAVAMFGTYLGARLAIFFSGTAQLILFSFVMAVAAFFMLKPKKSKEASQSNLNKKYSYVLLSVEGLAVGVLTGLVGVGGGFMIVPALVLLAHLPMKLAVGTSLLIIAFKSFAGFVGYLGQVQVPWKELGLFTVFSVIGIFIGSALVKKVPAESLKKIFGIFLILMSLFILFKNREVFLQFF